MRRVIFLNFCNMFSDNIIIHPVQSDIIIVSISTNMLTFFYLNDQSLSTIYNNNMKGRLRAKFGKSIVHSQKARGKKRCGIKKYH